jgi:tRNA nucleotidyltransferase (CCA-adding enzyme)
VAVVRGSRVDGIVDRDTLALAVGHGATRGLALLDLAVAAPVELPRASSLASLRAAADRAGLARGFVREAVGRSPKAVAARDAGARVRVATLRGGRARTTRLRALPPDALADLAPDLRGLAAPLDAIEAELRDLLVRLGRAARRAGGRAWLVGGVLRDLLLGRRPADCDVAIEDADPARVATLAGAEALEEHPRFGTASAVVGGRRCDLARTRSERYARPGALPEVTPAPLVADLARRDFTVNAMALALDPSRFGRVIDPFGGAGDLRGRRLRVLHGVSFLEDPTRILRAARFEARFGFRIERATRRLIDDAVARGSLDRVSPARLLREIERSLDEERPAAAVRALVRIGAIGAIVPGLAPTRETYRRLARVRPTLDRLGGSARGIRPWLAALATLVVDGDPAIATAWTERLRPDRRATAALLAAPVEIPRVVRELERARGKASRIVRACRALPPELAVASAAYAGPGPARDAVARYFEGLASVRPDVTGHDLVARGAPPGPAIARGLAAALAAKLDRGADRDAQLRAASRALDTTKGRNGN